MLDSNYKGLLRAILNKSRRQQPAKLQLYGHQPQKLSKLDEPDMLDTAGEVRTNLKVIYSREPLHMDKQRQDGQLEPIYNSSVLILDIALKTTQEQLTIGTDGKRGSRRSVLAEQHDIYIYIYVCVCVCVCVL